MFTPQNSTSMEWPEPLDDPSILDDPDNASVQNSLGYIPDDLRLNDFLSAGGLTALSLPAVPSPAVHTTHFPPLNQHPRPPALPLSQPRSSVTSLASRHGVTKSRSKLTSQREGTGRKSQRRTIACWRCRKYKKQCDDDIVCASCSTSGFRIWPSELACRRERLFSMTDCYLPANCEAFLLNLPPMTRTLRSGFVPFKVDDQRMCQQNTSEGGTNSWKQVRYRLGEISMFHHDLDDLIDVAEAFEKANKQSANCLATCRALLIGTCQLYSCFLTPGETTDIPPAKDIASFFGEVRRQLHRAFTHVERLCLSSKPNDWFSAILSVSFLTIAAIIFIDMMFAVPSLVRGQMWGDYYERRSWMRNGSYNMLVSLLRVSTRGVNPVQLECFDQDENDSPPLSAAAQANTRYKTTLLPHVDDASLAALVHLRSWIKRHELAMRNAAEMFRKDEYGSLVVPPIGKLVKVYTW